MVLILSTSQDQSTYHVLKWLKSYGTPFIRINPEDVISVDRIQLSSNGLTFQLSINNETILDFTEISAFWYRRGQLSLNKKAVVKSEFEFFLEDYLAKESDTVAELLSYWSTSIPHINSIEDNQTNKLVNLVIANQVGLATPQSLITSKPDIIPTDGKWITKAMYNGGFSWPGHASVGAFTSEIHREHLGEGEYAPSFLQQQLPKKYEVRSFFLDGDFYSCAIFSQANQKTQVDFRNYDQVNPNRVVPIALPTAVEQSVKALFSKLAMNCGSVDFIVTPENEYVFLEVNPIGQFSQVSIPGGFNLPQKIAKLLTRYEQAHTRPAN